MAGSWSKRGSAMGALFAAAAASLFGRNQIDGITLSKGRSFPDYHAWAEAKANPFRKRKPGCSSSYTKKGPGRYAIWGRSKRPSYTLFALWRCKAERIPLYLHAFARRRYLSGAANA